MTNISKTHSEEDFLLERDLFEFIDDLESFQSSHKKKKDYLGKKTYRKDLDFIDREDLVLITYRRNKEKIKSEYLDSFFNFINRSNKTKLIQIMTIFEKLKKI